MFKKAISLALMFALTLAFVPAPAKAQFDPPITVEKEGLRVLVWVNFNF
jgi:hypothetical protein